MSRWRRALAVVLLLALIACDIERPRSPSPRWPAVADELPSKGLPMPVIRKAYTTTA